MSMAQWANIGLGIELSCIRPYLDAKKLRKLLAENGGSYFDNNRIWRTKNNEAQLDRLDEWAINITDGICGIIKYADSLDMLITGNNNDGEYYLFYSPHYGWEKNGGFKTEAEARSYIADLLSEVVKENTTVAEVSAAIDYIETYAEG